MWQYCHAHKCIVFADLKGVLIYKYVVCIFTTVTQQVNMRVYMNSIMCPCPFVSLNSVNTNVFYVPPILRTGLKPGSPAGGSWLVLDTLFYFDYESKKSDSAFNVRGCLTWMRNKHDERLPYKEDIVRSVFRVRGVQSQIKAQHRALPCRSGLLTSACLCGMPVKWFGTVHR